MSDSGSQARMLQGKEVLLSYREFGVKWAWNIIFKNFNCLDCEAFLFCSLSLGKTSEGGRAETWTHGKFIATKKTSK